MNVKLITKTISNTLIVSVLALFVVSTGFAKKGGNGGGKPGGGDDPVCSGLEDETPTIAFVTPFEKTGGRDGYYFEDIYLSDSSGCNTYLVMAEAAKWLPDSKRNEGMNRFIRNASGIKLGFNSNNRGIVVWYNSYTDPWSLSYFSFSYDPDTKSVLFDTDTPQFFESPNFGHDIVEIDVLLTEADEPLVAMIEWNNDDPDHDNHHHKTSVVNLANSSSYEEVTSGNCQPEFNGECYYPYLYSMAWDPNGEAFYYGVRDLHGSNAKAGIARTQYSEGAWQLPEMVLLGVTNDSINGQSVSPDGELAYSYDDGALNGLRNVKIGIIPIPEDCIDSIDSICGKHDGDHGFDRYGTQPSWTSSGTLLFSPIGRNEIREYVDPLGAVEGVLLIPGVGEFDSGL